MGFSSVAILQREKEAKALKSFLLYSLMGSLALHIGILSLGISKLLQRVSETKDQPIEITIIEDVPQEIAQVQQIQTSPIKINSGGGGGNNAKSSISAATAISVTKPYITPIVKQPQPKTTHNFIFKQPQTPTKPKPTTTPTAETIPTEKTTPEPTRTIPTTETTTIEKTTSREQLNEKLDTPATTQPTPKQTVIPNTKPSDIEAPKTTTTISTNFNISSRNSLGGNNLGTLSNRLKNSFNKGSGNGVSNVSNGTGNGIGNGVGNGTGNGIGNGVGNEVENKRVATAPKPRQENGSKLNRADCIRCDIKYPDRARRRGIEGKAEVAIDTDANGNVTLVRLILSSGDSELDEAAQQAAQEWKLKPTDGGREGVRASVNFAIKGSQRHRQLQERRRQTKPKIEVFTPSQPVKSDTNNQADESRTEEVAAPPSTTPTESNSDSENSN